MSIRPAYLYSGLVLLALGGAWFFTPLGTHVLALLGLDAGARPQGFDTPDGASTLELVSLGLNALNALFAGLGVYFTAKGLIGKSPAP